MVPKKIVKCWNKG